MRKTCKLLLASLFFATVWASVASAAEEGKLLIWMQADKAYNGMQKIGDRFFKDTGIEVKVEHPDAVIDKFLQAAQAGKGPDGFQWAHDRLGDMVNGGLITSLDIDAKFRKQIVEKAWKAFTMNGKVYGYPYAMEAVGLIYNKDLVPNPPATFEEILELDKTMRQGERLTFLYDYNNFYFSFPLLSAHGGYVFGEDNGALNPKDVGLNTPGALKGMEFLNQLITDGVMPKGATYSVMDAKMNKGELAMMINGPWSLANLKKNRINYGVATIPTFQGKQPRPFVGVQGIMINRSSPNIDLMREFMEGYVLTNEGLEVLNDDVPLGAPPYKRFFFQLAKNPDVKAIMENVKVGVLMPSIPEMGSVWSAMPGALGNMTRGKQTPQEALETAYARITRND